MSSIEILENTLLKLLVRRGTDLDRKVIVLDEGELGYAVDTNRLFVGDGVTAGGKVVGNTFLGAAGDITTLAPGQIGDLAWDNDDKALYYIVRNDGALASDWVAVGNTITAADGTLIKSAGTLRVGTLSAGNFSDDAVGVGVVVDSGRISLSSEISVDKIALRDTTASNYLELPSKIQISDIQYNFPPAPAGSNDSVLTSDVNQNLTWNTPTVIYTPVPTTSATVIPVGTITPYVSAASQVPYGWLVCDGSEVAGVTYPVLSSVIAERYGSTSPGITFKLPDYTNKTLYGSDTDDPYLSTEYRLLSGTDGTTGITKLSATGATFLIKAIQEDMTSLVDLVYPVGSVHISTDNTNPGTRFTGTTWERIADGRFIAGVGTGTDINANTLTVAAGEGSVGEYIHTLTEAEMPEHTHTIQNVFEVTEDSDIDTDGGDRFNFAEEFSTSGATGGSEPHNNIPPYFGLYIWKRTA